MSDPKAQGWSPDNYASTTSGLLTALRELRASNPKAVRPTVHLYPPSVYARDDPNEGETSAAAQRRAGAELRERRITSWKMTEHLYRRTDNQFPTMARGLFVEDVTESDGDASQDTRAAWGAEGPVKERIVARGYDKFFNVGEVAWTEWDAMEKHTAPPYRLTLKSNGCLILIAALTPEYLMVASKHSLGTTTEADMPDPQDSSTRLAQQLDRLGMDKGKGKAPAEGDGADIADMQHAEAGREWLRRMLKNKGASEAQLAKRLWHDNLTAVCELCDDTFEEHVIATPAHSTGLILHGLNQNTPLFSTSSPDKVHDFAQEFGFIPTKFTELPSLAAVKGYVAEVAQAGTWEGEMIEGFVVRCTVQNNPSATDRPPYSPGSPFFFKVKFEEPYLLYRQFREITRTMLPLLESPSKEEEDEIWAKVRRRAKRPEVKLYAEWAGRAMKQEPALFDDYNRGIVRVRDRFLAWTEAEGKEEWRSLQDGGKTHVLETKSPKDMSSGEGKPKKWLIVPAAIPGCGKTHVGVALNKLYGIGHTQSDDVTTKKSAPAFLNNIAALLKTHDIVYADRNNHLDKHYKELSELAGRKELQNYDLRLIALAWDIDDQPYHKVLRVCCDRVVSRGDNHATLRPDPETKTEHEAIVGRFLRDYIPPDPAAYDRIITVHLQDSPADALKAIVPVLGETCGLPASEDADISAAIAAADSYKSTTPYHPMKQRLSKSIRYYGLAVEMDLRQAVKSAFATVTHNTTSSLDMAKELFETLVAAGRITDKAHVTLTHEKTVAAEKEALGQSHSPGDGEPAVFGPQQQLWNTCAKLADAFPAPVYHFDLTHLVWDQDVMAFVVENFQAGELPEVDGQAGDHLPLEVPDELRGQLHITVGTRSPEVEAYEAKRVVSAVRDIVAKRAETGGKEECGVGEVEVDGKTMGWIKLSGLAGEGRIKGMW